jgi:biopolymer transport protein ExbD
MSWRVRHEGSPRSIDNLTLAQVVEGLTEGHWEPTDEVMGPGELAWVPIENHPQLAEAAAELEPPAMVEPEDESRLDMNALIDVCLVLLVFFIITTTYAALQKRMKAPIVTKDVDGVRVIVDKQLYHQMIKVKARMKNGQPVITVEDTPVPADTDQISLALRRWVAKGSLNEVLLDHTPDVPHGTVVMIQDAALSADMQRISLVVP